MLKKEKHANITECRLVCEAHDAQAVVIVRVERDGTITTSTYGETEKKCGAIGDWAQGSIKHALSVVPLRTVFGMGNKGIPLTLSDEEKAQITNDGAQKFIEEMAKYE